MKSHNSKYFIPPLLKISPIEANAIVSMFRLYDYKATGKIPRHLAKKLTISLGFDVPIGNLSSEIGVRELLLFLDQWCPEKDPPLPNSLHFFNRLACEPTVDDNESDHVTSNSISNFMDSLGRPPISKGEVNLLLTSMLDYDDCSETASVNVDLFAKELTLFTKKTNVLKDFH